MGKCSFAQLEEEFIGHRVCIGKLMIGPNKVKTIQEWQPPSNISELRYFLGLVNYYRRSVKGYSDIAASLIKLLKKNKLWAWTQECQSALVRLKVAMIEDPVMSFAIPNHMRDTLTFLTLQLVVF